MLEALLAAAVVVIAAGVGLFLFMRSRSVKPGGVVRKSVESIGAAQTCTAIAAPKLRPPVRAKVPKARCAKACTRALRRYTCS